MVYVFQSKFYFGQDALHWRIKALKAAADSENSLEGPRPRG